MLKRLPHMYSKVFRKYHRIHRNSEITCRALRVFQRNNVNVCIVESNEAQG